MRGSFLYGKLDRHLLFFHVQFSFCEILQRDFTWTVIVLLWICNLHSGRSQSRFEAIVNHSLNRNKQHSQLILFRDKERSSLTRLKILSRILNWIWVPFYWLLTLRFLGALWYLCYFIWSKLEMSCRKKEIFSHTDGMVRIFFTINMHKVFVWISSYRVRYFRSTSVGN